ncbi:DoxX family protein [Rhodococcus pyridinivorans]|uniref:DoxX family protein n=1 Tax=Rhodococcus pyridinivorans TaxID=103816 RepID=UPI0036CEC0B1
MTALTVVLAVLAALPFTVFGLAKVTGRLGMLERAAHLGFTEAAYRRIGVLEIFGAAGLLVGLAFPVIRSAAAGCLLVLAVSGAALHLRSGDGSKGAAPALVAAMLVVLYGVVGANT